LNIAAPINSPEPTTITKMPFRFINRSFTCL
jgi:hypothetical protein